MHRKKSFLIIVLACILLWGCSADKQEVSMANGTISTSEAVTSIPATALPAASEFALEPTPEPASVSEPEPTSEKTTFFSAEEWFTEDGHMDYPFDLSILLTDMDLKKKFDMLEMPQEALDKASTEDILSIIKRWPMQPSLIFERPSLYLWVMEEKNFMQEFWSREDMAEVTLEAYKEETFMPICYFGDEKEQRPYQKRCREREEAIVTGEIFLATDMAFEQMDDAMRQETLEAVEEKAKLREDGRFACIPESCGFWAYISDSVVYGSGSKWYEYIKETQPENTELIESLERWIGGSWHAYQWETN